MAAEDTLNNGTSVVDEVAAAEAELKAAQERLAAAKAKQEAAAAEAAAGAGAAGGAAAAAAAGAAGGAAAAAAQAAPSATAAETATAAAGAATAAVPPQQPAGYTVPEGYSQPTYGTAAPAADGSYQQPYQPQQPNYAYQQGQPQQPYYTYQQPQQPQQPYYQPQYAPQPVAATKDHVAAGLLAIFLGFLGIHKFYLGYNTSGFIMLGVSILGGILTLGIAPSVIWLISVIEGILYFTKSQTEFEQMYVFNKREWF